MSSNEQFEKIRRWGQLRGLKSAPAQVQFQRCMQELCEIHDAIVKEDIEEVVDAIGDTVVTLVNLATAMNLKIEDCIDSAFNEIEKRKGLNINGDFIRYAKLNDEDKSICDLLQGAKGSDHYIIEPKPEAFFKDMK